jgi:hypothetical protein
MRKIFTFVALALFSVMSWATVNITVNPNVIDFGTVNLNANGEAESDWASATLTWSGLQPYCSVFVDTLNAPDPGACEFSISSTEGGDFWYGGDEWNEPADPTVWVMFYAIAPGEYSVRYSFYSYEDEDWEVKSQGTELLVKVKVQALGTDVENVQGDKVQCTKALRNGRVLIRRNGETYFITGERVND